jgi:hypothetical protein
VVSGGGDEAVWAVVIFDVSWRENLAG